MPMIETRDGTRLNVKSWGGGRPVVLIHGWPLAGDSWDPVAVALADAGYRAIAYDRRGFGRSDQPWRGYDYDTFADDLADVMQSQDAHEDVALVGFSMGGGEVARYLSRHGGKGVSQVALVSSIVPYLLQTDDNPQGAPEATLQQIGDGVRQDRAHFLRGFFKDFFGAGLLSSPVSSEVLDHAWNSAMQAGLHPTLAAAEAFGHTDFRPDLASFTVPTLVIHGTADKTVPIDATGRAVARAVSQATLIEYDGEPHGVFATQTARLTRDLLEFLGGPGTVLDDFDRVPAQDRQALIDELTYESLATPRI